jgi:hypothetical protein
MCEFLIGIEYRKYLENIIYHLLEDDETVYATK